MSSTRRGAGRSPRSSEAWCSCCQYIGQITATEPVQRPGRRARGAPRGAGDRARAAAGSSTRPGPTTRRARLGRRRPTSSAARSRMRVDQILWPLGRSMPSPTRRSPTERVPELGVEGPGPCPVHRPRPGPQTIAPLHQLRPARRTLRGPLLGLRAGAGGWSSAAPGPCSCPTTSPRRAGSGATIPPRRCAALGASSSPGWPRSPAASPACRSTTRGARFGRRRVIPILFDRAGCGRRTRPRRAHRRSCSSAGWPRTSARTSSCAPSPAGGRRARRAAGPGRRARLGRLRGALRRLADELAPGAVTIETGLARPSCGAATRAGAFLCLSEHEGFCIPLLEAFHFGVPVIARTPGRAGGRRRRRRADVDETGRPSWPSCSASPPTCAASRPAGRGAPGRLRCRPRMAGLVAQVIVACAAT